jgi:hypothetical protein
MDQNYVHLGHSKETNRVHVCEEIIKFNNFSFYEKSAFLERPQDHNLHFHCWGNLRS